MVGTDYMSDFSTQLSQQEVLNRAFDATTNTVKTTASLASTTAFSARLNDVDISVKATPGNLLSVSGTSINAGLRYLQVHNKATAPANPDVPVFSFPIPAGTATAPAVVSLGRDFFGPGGHYLSTGIAVGISTTADTFTAATTTDHVTNGTYV